MTVEKYRQLALALPEVAEGSPRLNRGALKLTIEQQKSLMAAEPACFGNAVGAWGRKGWTLVQLQRANSAIVGRVLEMAWRNVAPKRLAAQFDKS